MTVTRSNTKFVPAAINMPYSFANEQRFPSAAGVVPITMSRDQTTIYGAVRNGGGTGLYTINDITGVPTLLATFPERVYALVETYDGEALCVTGNLGGTGNVRRSTGWSVNKATATWAVVLALPGGIPLAEYSANRWSMGTNGVMVISEQGVQTPTSPTPTGDNAADNATALSNAATGCARRVFLTADNGKNWTLLWDIMTSTPLEPRLNAGTHPHAWQYDEEFDMVVGNFGDNTGSGPLLYGTDRMQIVYCYDFRAVLTGGTPTWNTFPLMTDYPSTNKGDATQWVAMTITPQGITMSSDGIPLALLFIPKTGYRQFGQPRIGWMYPITNGTPILGRDISWAGPGKPMIASFSINNGTTGTLAYLPHLGCSPDGGVNWYEIWRDPVRTRRQTDRVSAFGPTVNNKYVAATQDTGNGASANGYIITWDLVTKS